MIAHGVVADAQSGDNLGAQRLKGLDGLLGGRPHVVVFGRARTKDGHAQLVSERMLGDAPVGLQFLDRVLQQDRRGRPGAVGVGGKQDNQSSGLLLVLVVGGFLLVVVVVIVQQFVPPIVVFNGTQFYRRNSGGQRSSSSGNLLVELRRKFGVRTRHAAVYNRNATALQNALLGWISSSSWLSLIWISRTGFSRLSFSLSFWLRSCVVVRRGGHPRRRRFEPCCSSSC